MAKLRDESLRHIVEELKAGNDRACAVVACTMLDFQLKQLLQAHVANSPLVRSLLVDSQILDTFSGKTALAGALGLLPEDASHDLYYIRKIRNKFSHYFDVTDFNSKPIPEWTNKLKGVRWLLDWHKVADKPISDTEVKDISSKSRRKFIITVGVLVIMMDTMLPHVKPCASTGTYDDVLLK